MWKYRRLCCLECWASNGQSNAMVARSRKEDYFTAPMMGVFVAGQRRGTWKCRVSTYLGAHVFLDGADALEGAFNLARGAVVAHLAQVAACPVDARVYAVFQIPPLPLPLLSTINSIQRPLLLQTAKQTRCISCTALYDSGYSITNTACCTNTPSRACTLVKVHDSTLQTVDEVLGVSMFSAPFGTFPFPLARFRL